jgi:hypothetical protein
MSTPSRRVRLVGGLLALVLAASPGCATLPGLLTGAFTGAVDAPAQVYRYHRAHFDRNPIYWPFNLALFVPLGIATGPLVGMAKGIALDVQWLIGQVGYQRVFATYREPSIWRPFTIHW